MKFLKRNAKWVAIAVLLVVAAILIVSGLTQKQPSGANTDKGKNESVDNDKSDSVDKDKEPEINVVEEDGVEPLAIGFKFGYTKYENGVEDFGYTGEGLTIYEGLRKDQCVFFATADGRDTISKYREKLTAWEGDGGVFVNGYREKVPLVKYGGNAYYIYLTDGGCNIVPEVGMKVSIQGAILDGKGGKATFHPATFEYEGNGVWKIVSRKAIRPQEKPAQHVTIKIEGWDTSRKDEANLFFLAEKGCAITKVREKLFSWTSGGIYVNGERVSVPIVKHSPVGFYVYFAAGGSTITPVKGMKVGIQGTLSDGKNTTTFEPATFEYLGGGKWALISRAQVIPESDIRPQPAAGEKEVYIYGSTRKDTNSTFFETSSNDTLPYTVGEWKSKAKAIDEETSGVYVNNVKKDIELIKHNENSYLIYWAHCGVTLVPGMKISIQGTFTMGEQSITFHPVTFEYQEGGKSTIVSRKVITPEKEKPGEVVKVTVSWNADREDDCLFMKTDKADAITKMKEPLTQWTNGGVYADGVKVSVRMIKHATTGYYLDFSATNCEVTPVAGMKISIQGVLTDGFNSVEFLPATFEYDGNEKWALVSRDAIVEAPTPTEATLSWNSSRTDVGCLFFLSDIAVTHSGTVDAFPEFADGGIYVNGVKTKLRVVRHGDKKYYIAISAHNIAVERGTTVGIQGTFTLGGQTLTVKPATFEYDGNGTWTVVSREEVEEVVVANLTWNTSRPDSNLFLVSNVAVEHSGTVDAFPTFIDGGIYVNDEKTKVRIVRHGANNYYIYFAASNYEGEKPVQGTRVRVEGTFVLGGQTLTVKAVTFEYDGAGSWSIVS